MLHENLVGIAVDTEIRNNPVSECYETGQVARLVRRALYCGGLDEFPNAPLKSIIEPGSTVLLKPNWVIHANKGSGGMECLVTHPLFIETVLREVVLAKPGKIIIADAPIQRCDFTKLVPMHWQQRLQEIAGDIPLFVRDLRRTVSAATNVSFVAQRELISVDRYQMFDLASDSILEPVSSPTGKFRITCYNPDLLAQEHCPGRHRYLIARELFEADVVINLPKLKTHRKAGITAALKNFVGINGDKDYLPHHRIGGALDGGDCYQNRSFFKNISELFLDEANRKINTHTYKGWLLGSIAALKAAKITGCDTELEGGWHGNDTVWRMVLDLNRIALYGRSDGSMSKTTVRRIFSLTDGIVAGQGNGPLESVPLIMGAVTFAISSAHADRVHCALLRLPWDRIPLVRESFGTYDFPLTTGKNEESQTVTMCNGIDMSLTELRQSYGLNAEPPTGWADILNDSTI